MLTVPASLPGPSQPPGPRHIALYNILWAELDSDHRTLTIDYACEVSKTLRRAAKLSFPFSPEAAAPEAATPDSVSEWVQHLMARSYGPAPRRRRAYVLVNPHAGPGGAVKIWESQVKPIFDAARMPLTIHQTTFSGEAVSLVENMDIDQFDIVVPCSGDGLPHEVFNGLGRRPDARRALSKIAVAHVPCGSGNALACNVFGTHRPSLAALAIVKGVATPLDLISITQGDRRILSFLSQALGIMAEADLGTEHLRWMGEHRFTYGVIMRILKKKIYPCDLWAKVDIDHKDGVRDHYRRERENTSVLELDKMTASLGSATQAGGGQSSVADSDEATGNDDATGLPPLKYGTVNDKLPQGWEKVGADKVGNFYCGNVSRRASSGRSPIGRAQAPGEILAHPRACADRLHGSRCHLLQRRLAQRRAYGPRHRRWRRAHPEGPGPPPVRQQQLFLRQSLSHIPQGLGLPHHPQGPERRVHQHRRREGPV